MVEQQKQTKKIIYFDYDQLTFVINASLQATVRIYTAYYLLLSVKVIV